MEKKKVQALNKEFSKLFCVITEHDVFKNLSPQKKELFKTDAQMIQKSELWKWLLTEMRIEAEKKMFFDALTVDDMVGGKFMLYTIDIISKKIDNLSK